MRNASEDTRHTTTLPDLARPAPRQMPLATSARRMPHPATITPPDGQHTLRRANPSCAVFPIVTNRGNPLRRRRGSNRKEAAQKQQHAFQAIESGLTSVLRVFLKGRGLVAGLGFEPRQTDSESVLLEYIHCNTKECICYAVDTPPFLRHSRAMLRRITTGGANE